MGMYVYLYVYSLEIFLIIYFLFIFVEISFLPLLVFNFPFRMPRLISFFRKWAHSNRLLTYWWRWKRRTVRRRKAATTQTNRSYIKKRCQPKWAREVRTLLYFMHYSFVFTLLISDMRTGMYYSGFDSVGENQSLRWQQLLRHQDSSCRH